MGQGRLETPETGQGGPLCLSTHRYHPSESRWVRTWAPELKGRGSVLGSSIKSILLTGRRPPRKQEASDISFQPQGDSQSPVTDPSASASLPSVHSSKTCELATQGLGLCWTLGTHQPGPQLSQSGSGGWGGQDGSILPHREQ